jgi:hypothetical protein
VAGGILRLKGAGQQRQASSGTLVKWTLRETQIAFHGSPVSPVHQRGRADRLMIALAERKASPPHHRFQRKTVEARKISCKPRCASIAG